MPPDGESRLLKAAVVSLEKKLRESQAVVAALQQQVADLRRERDDLRVVRGRLAETLAAKTAAEDQVEQLRRELKRSQAVAEDAQRHLNAAGAAAEAAAAAEAERAAAAAVWRADGEAATLEGARATGRAKVLAAQVQQLEAANAGLRFDNQAHATRLKEAYEREGELLAEVAELQARLRQGQTPVLPAPPAPSSKTPPPLEGEAASLEQAQQDLFVAAAQQLTQECAARVQQAEHKAAQLEERLQSSAATVEQLRRETGELAESLAAVQERCSREADAASALLETNLRLHESVAQLTEQLGMDADSSGIEGRRAAAGVPACPAAPAAARGQRQERQPRSGQGRQPRPAPQPPAHQWLPAKRSQQLAAQKAGSEKEEQEASGHLISAARPTARQERGRVGWAASQPPAAQPVRRGGAAVTIWQSSTEEQGPAATATALEGAVEAALALSSEHRKLLAYHKAVAGELQRVTSGLAVAPAAKQLALLRQHAELQAEMQVVAQQLEDKLAQLSALRRVGLL